MSVCDRDDCGCDELREHKLRSDYQGLEPGDRVLHVNVGTLPGVVRSVNLGSAAPQYPYHVEWANGLWSLNSRAELRDLAAG